MSRSKKQVKPKEKKLEMLGQKPNSIAVDGHGIRIISDREVDLVFIQTVGNDKAQAVGGFRINLGGLKRLNESLDKTIKDIESKK